jgi:hypothetical protein
MKESSMRRLFEIIDAFLVQFYDWWAQRPAKVRLNAMAHRCLKFVLAVLVVSVPLCVVLALLTAGSALLVVALALPLVLSLAAGFVMFARAWVREFGFLMRLSDDAFPGRHDKLGWTVLLIALPPVGVDLFSRFRLAHWPEAKPTTAHDYF